ncbi:MAG: hypothetical protein IM613_12655 [Cytophagales bacterium]|nr:hypothetical protein [Cytophagales bacterium]
MTSDPDLLRRWQGMASQNNTIQQSSFSSMVLNGTEMKGANNMVSKQTRYTKTNRRKKGMKTRSGILTLIPESLKNKSYLDYYRQRLQYYQPTLWSDWSLPILETNIAAFIALNKYAGFPDYLFSTEKLDQPLNISGWEDVAYYTEFTGFDVVLPDNIDDYAGVYLPYNRFAASSERYRVAKAYTDNYSGFALIPLWTESEDWVRTQVSLTSPTYFIANVCTGITGKGTGAELLTNIDNLYMGFCNHLSFDRNGVLYQSNYFATTIVNTNAPLTTSQAIKWYKALVPGNSLVLAKSIVNYDHFGATQPLLHYAEFVGNTGTSGWSPLGDAVVNTDNNSPPLVFSWVSKDASGEPNIITTESITGTPQQPTIMGRSTTDNDRVIFWKGDWLRYADNPAYSSYANRKLAEALVDYEW